MPEPDPPHHPSCWAFTRGAWTQGRVMSAEPFPGSRLGPNWDPGEPVVMVHTRDGHWDPVMVRHVILIGDVDRWPPAPSEPPVDWEPDEEETPGFLG